MSFTVEPKPIIDIDENNVKFISKWNVVLEKRNLKYDITCKSDTYLDLQNHPSLFYNAKKLGMQIPNEFYEYTIHNNNECIIISSKNIDVLKLAIYKIFKPHIANKKLTIKRQWKISIRPPKIVIDENEDISVLPLWEDNDY